MATLTGLIPVTVGTFEAYHGGAGGGYHWGGGGGGGWERRAQDHRYKSPSVPTASSCNYIALRVQVSNNQVLGYWVIVIIVQVLGKCVSIGYLDP